jgi:hypothetical protein
MTIQRRLTMGIINRMASGLPQQRTRKCKQQAQSGGAVAEPTRFGGFWRAGARRRENCDKMTFG